MTAFRSKRMASLGIFLGLSMILSYVEAIIPIPIGIPGVKLGLANSAILLLLLRERAKDAFLVSMVRILLSGMLFGNVFSLIYSLSGGILSFFVMLFLLRKIKLHEITASIFGGVFHNIGQIIAAFIVLNSAAVMYYIPVLMVSGIITGALIGFISSKINIHLKHIQDGI